MDLDFLLLFLQRSFQCQLVDYGDDEDEDDENGESDSAQRDPLLEGSPAKRKKLEPVTR